MTDVNDGSDEPAPVDHLPDDDSTVRPRVQRRRPWNGECRRRWVA